MTHMTHLHFCLVVTRLILCHALFHVHDTHDTFTKKTAHGGMKKTLGVAKHEGLPINSFSAVDMIAVVIYARLKFSQQVSSQCCYYHRIRRRVDYRRYDSKLSADSHKQCHELFAYLNASR